MLKKHSYRYALAAIIARTRWPAYECSERKEPESGCVTSAVVHQLHSENRVIASCIAILVNVYQKTFDGMEKNRSGTINNKTFHDFPNRAYPIALW